MKGKSWREWCNRVAPMPLTAVYIIIQLTPATVPPRQICRECGSTARVMMEGEGCPGCQCKPAVDRDPRVVLLAGQGDMEMHRMCDRLHVVAV